MKRQNLVKTLMAIFLIVPLLAGAAEKGNQKQVTIIETSKTTIGSAVINQEVIQILRKGNSALITMNILGQPGVYFKVQYSKTGAEDSYVQMPAGKGVIGGNGFGMISVDLRKLGKEDVYLKITTSDTADFAKPRVMQKPLALAVDQVKIKDRGLIEKIKRTEIEEWKLKDEVLP